MLIKNTSISVKYKKIENIKKSFIESEKKIKGVFNEATMLPIPDDAPPEIPRIIIKTLNEHSQLNISPVATTLSINYSDGFEKDWSKCEQYILQKMEVVFSLLNNLTENQYEYIGIVTEVLLDEYLEGAKVLANNLLKNKNDVSIYDLNIRYTFVEDDKVFVNIMLQNARIFKEGINPNVAGNLSIENQNAETIGAVIDINDRFGYNNYKDYKTDSTMLNGIVRKMTDVIDNKLINLMEKGEY